LTKYGDSLSLQIFAVIVRILFGVALVIGASESKYPIVLQIFGWLLISAALVIGGIGRERFKKVVKWSVKLPTLIYRLASVCLDVFLYMLWSNSKIPQHSQRLKYDARKAASPSAQSLSVRFWPIAACHLPTSERPLSV